jgi:hypothetical protein
MMVALRPIPIMLAHNFMTARQTLLLAFAFNILLLLLRIYDLSLERYALYGDEAQYWTWAKALDWGYYSKPPVVAWAIAATTWAFGDSVFAIRLSSPIFHFGTAMVIYAITARWVNSRSAVWASITYATLPAVILSATIASTDPALLFFWAVSLYGLLRAEEKNEACWWVFTGLAAGLGGLSKYSMLFFGISAALHFYTKGTFQTQLKNKKLWLGVLAAIVVYLPNLWWNTQNHFVSYLHTSDNAEGKGFGFHPLELVEFVTAQFVVFGPILFAFLVLLLVRNKAQWKSFILPMLLTIATISLFSRAHANWAAPIYIAATIWVVSWLIKTKREHWLVISLALHLLLAVGFYGFEPIMKAANIELTKKTDPFKRLKGQTELADAARDIKKKFPNAKLISEERRIVASLMYYLRDGAKPAAIYKWNSKGTLQDHYDLISNMNAAKGADFIMIARTDNPRKFYPFFNGYQRLKPIVIRVHKDYVQTYQVYWLQGFKGY